MNSTTVVLFCVFKKLKFQKLGGNFRKRRYKIRTYANAYMPYEKNRKDIFTDQF